MAKSKLRFFRFCRPNDPSTLPPLHPVPAFQRHHNIVTVNFPPPPPPPPSPSRVRSGLLCKLEGGKMKGSMEVVKRSEDPYSDFKQSMMEMIKEKEIFEESDLEELLEWFLTLNSRVHHGVILEAFSDAYLVMID